MNHFFRLDPYTETLTKVRLDHQSCMILMLGASPRRLTKDLEAWRDSAETKTMDSFKINDRLIIILLDCATITQLGKET